MVLEYVYVFMGAKSSFPAGVFFTFEEAKSWIEKNKLSGSLNKMPVGNGLYDWAIEKGFFVPKKEHQKEAKFIQSFTCASIEHWHFGDGKG